MNFLLGAAIGDGSLSDSFLLRFFWNAMDDSRGTGLPEAACGSKTILSRELSGAAQHILAMARFSPK
jgi:hypothetical protein